MEEKDPTCRFTIDLCVEDHRKLKIIAATYNKSMRDIVVQSIKKIIEECGKS